MGEGHYRLIGVGCLRPMDHFGPHDDTSEKLDAFVEVMESKGVYLQSAYESEPDYLCVLVALDNSNASSAWNRRMPVFPRTTLPDLLQAAAPANPHLDAPVFLAALEKRVTLSGQIAELSKRIRELWVNRNYDEQDRLEAEECALHEKMPDLQRFACVLPAIPDSVAEHVPAEAVKSAHLAWETARQVAAGEFGVTLPDGRLIFADDWD